MGVRTLALEGQTGESPNPSFSSLFDFCVDSVTTCFSHDAGKLCVPIGLFSLSALLLLLSSLLLVCQRCKCRREHPGEIMTSLYCFLGNLCATTGAVMSKQLHILILMGAFAAAVDAVNCISCCFPVFLCWNSKTERRLRVIRRRRRQHLLAVCVLMVLAGGFLKSRVNHNPADNPLRGRRLLHFSLQDNTEILGYILGLLSFVITCTSRFPALHRAHRGRMLTRAHVFSGVLCSLAGALYATAILFYDTQLEFLLTVMPWLLSAICCVTLDPLILVIYWCKRGTREQPMRFSPDTESLLGGSTEEKAVVKRKQQVHSPEQTKTKNIPMTEMGRYMDVSTHPARKISPKEVTVSTEEVNDQPLNRTVRAIRVDSFCSSDTSYDSSLVSSDLEWDFEVGNAQWSEPKAKQQEGGEFPLQEWPRNPKPFNICTCAMSGLPQNSVTRKEERESGSAANPNDKETSIK
ncbi:transmembrane protein 44 isoform X1 [Thunnus maccoyii]|uniref:transmembrane protein 44 isoform X1 n=2 Tax=Thunnus maccoyii TaxID=8240 RepID=UPI001C4AA31D|nr:transmembrane protein 44 isoform X1 [Thunnus maccoyii]